MATSTAFNERVEACIAEMLRKEFPLMKTTSVNDIAQHGALSAAERAIVRLEEDYAGCRKLGFLDLPREIRDAIYAFVIVPESLSDEGIGIGVDQLDWGYDYWQSSTQPSFREGEDEQPPITRVSRQLRQEALPLYYQLTPFWVSIKISSIAPELYTGLSGGVMVNNPKVLVRWLKAIGTENIKHLRHFRVLCGLHKVDGSAQTLQDFLEQGGIALPEEVDI